MKTPLPSETPPPDTFPVLRLRATGPTGHCVAELKLGDQDLLAAGFVQAVDIHVGLDEISTATIRFEITADFDLPAEVSTLLTQYPGPIADE